MANFKETGVKISQFPEAPVNMTSFRHKLELKHRIISWAPSYYGISTISKNYQISLDSLRNDFKGFIGIDNAKGNYQNYLTIWKGNWSDVNDRTNSYIYTWDDNESFNKDYIRNKHGIDATYDTNALTDRIFILDTAPWPLQSTDDNVNPYGSSRQGVDPNPKTKKIVNKDYVDERHNGFRKVEKAENPLQPTQEGSILEIRPYTCFYQYSNPPAINKTTGVHTIDIRDSQTMQDGRTIKEMIEHNRVPFYIRLTNNDSYHKIDGEHKCNLEILVNGSKENVVWSYEDELIEIVRQNRNIKKADGGSIAVGSGYIFIRCEAEYINGVFTVNCSNFFGRDKKSKKITRVDFPIIKKEQFDATGNQITERTINLDLSLHEHETFLTSIPKHNANEFAFNPQYYISFDATGLDDYHEYTWDYFVITPDQDMSVDNEGNFTDKNYDDVIFQGTGKTSILWANQDAYSIAPKLQPNRVYCFEFCKIFDNVLIGRIKYFINLVKKN